MSLGANCTISPASPADYPGIVAIAKAIDPFFIYTPEGLLTDDTHVAQSHFHKRWLAKDQSGHLVGHLTVSNKMDMGEPGFYWGVIQILPSAQKQGVGSLLYKYFEECALPRDRKTLLTMVNLTGQTPGTDFVEKRGFLKKGGSQEFGFELQAWMPALASHPGISIFSVPELEQDPHWIDKLYDLYISFLPDIPLMADMQIPSMSDFLKMLERDKPSHPIQCVAVGPTRYEGLSFLVRTPHPSVAYTHVTGVRREARKSGLGTTLKFAAMQRAKQIGMTTVLTQCHADNAPMITLNMKLGFRPQRTMAIYMKQMESA